MKITYNGKNGEQTLTFDDTITNTQIRACVAMAVATFIDNNTEEFGYPLEISDVIFMAVFLLTFSDYGDEIDIDDILGLCNDKAFLDQIYKNSALSYARAAAYKAFNKKIDIIVNKSPMDKMFDEITGVIKEVKEKVLSEDNLENLSQILQQLNDSPELAQVLSSMAGSLSDKG